MVVDDRKLERAVERRARDLAPFGLRPSSRDRKAASRFMAVVWRRPGAAALRLGQTPSDFGQ